MTYFYCKIHGRQLTDVGREDVCAVCEQEHQRTPPAPRPTRDAWLLDMAALVAQRATCARRSVGCVLANARGQVLATGYNGRPRGFDHCRDGTRCPGADAPSGERLDECEAIHAEANSLLQCGDVEAIDTAYVTVSPCVGCVKLLLNTSCRRIVAGAPYPHDARSKELWARGDRVWVDAPPPAPPVEDTAAAVRRGAVAASIIHLRALAFRRDQAGDLSDAASLRLAIELLGELAGVDPEQVP